MGLELIRLGGGALRHILGVLLLAWRRVVRTAGIALVAGIVVTEVAGALVTHHFPPYLLTHVVALAIGIVVAYCAGMMVLVDELLKGALDLVRMGLGEAEAGARAAAIIAEREVGDVWGWAQRLIVGRDAPRAARAPRLATPRPTSVGTPPAASGAPRANARTLGQFPVPRATSGAPTPVAAEPAGTARLRVPPRLGTTRPPAPAPARDETRDDIAATDAFRKTAPPSPSNMHPVRADQLPRIEWAAEGLAAGAALLESALAARARRAQPGSVKEQPPPPAGSPTPAALETIPPLPQRAPAATAAAPTRAALESDGPVMVAPPTVPLAPPAPPTVPLTPPTTPEPVPGTVPPAALFDRDPAVEPQASPRPSPRPSSPVRTVPVITDEASRAALEAAEEEPDEHGLVGVDDAAPAARTTAAPVASIAEAADTPTAADAEEPAATWEPPSRVVVLPAAVGQAPRAAREAGGNEGVWADDEGGPQGAEERGLWTRIGQALARSTTRPLRERDQGDADGEPDRRDERDQHAP